MTVLTWGKRLGVLSFSLLFVLLFQNFSKTPAQSDQLDETLFLSGLQFDLAAVTNSKNQSLPKNYTSGGLRPSLGGANLLPPRIAFGTGNRTGENAIVLFTPQNKSDWTRIWFKLPQLAPAKKWFLSFTAGHLTALKSEEAYVSVVVSANSPIDNLTETKEIKSFLVQPGKSETFFIPLGLWPLKKNFSVRFRVGKNRVSESPAAVVFDEIKLMADKARPESGMQRAGLAREKPSSPGGQYIARDRVFRNLSYLKPKWFRTGWAGGSDEEVKDVILRAKQAKQKVLLTLVPNVSDYDSRDPYVLSSVCAAKKSLPLSTVNHTKYRARLQTFIRKIKAAGLTIESFEVGNEFDYICYNGDAPNGPDQEFTAEDELKWARGYALFLESSAIIIRQEFPDSKIITFGMANIPDWFTPLRGFHLLNSGRTLALLRNLEINGVQSNYFRYADGIGTHLYPHPNSEKFEDRNGNSILTSNVNELGWAKKPFWITEWGYRETSFDGPGKTNKFGETRQDLFFAFLEMLNEQSSFDLGPSFLYAMESPGDKGFDKDNVEKEVYTLVDQTKPFEDPHYWLPEALVFQRLYNW